MNLRVLPVAILVVLLPFVLSDETKTNDQSPQQDTVVHLSVNVTTQADLNQQQCDAGEIYSNCGEQCEATCYFNPARHARPLSCDSGKCKRGCFCKPGWVRHGRKCIKIERCPTRPGKLTASPLS